MYRKWVANATQKNQLFFVLSGIDENTRLPVLASSTCRYSPPASIPSIKTDNGLMRVTELAISEFVDRYQLPNYSKVMAESYIADKVLEIDKTAPEFIQQAKRLLAKVKKQYNGNKIGELQCELLDSEGLDAIIRQNPDVLIVWFSDSIPALHSICFHLFRLIHEGSEINEQVLTSLAVIANKEEKLANQEISNPE